MDYKAENIVTAEAIKNIFESDIFLSLIVFFLIVKICSLISVVNIPYIPNNLFFADVTRGALESLVNDERANMGLSALHENPQLDLAAQLKAEDMVKKGYFNHISPDGITPWQWITQAGYKYKYAGENLAVGFYDSQNVFEAWLNSPDHRDNLLNSHYTDFGTAVVSDFGDNRVNLVVQIFASPLTQPFVPKPQPKPVQNTTSPTITPENDSTAQANNPTPESPVVLGETSTNSAATTQPQNTVFSYDKILGISQAMDDASYLFFILAIGALSLLIISNFHNQNKTEFYSRKFVLRSVVVMAFLILSLLIDKGFILSIIPNQIII